MKRLAVVTFLFFAAVLTMAQNLIPLPANTVWGRLGIGSGPGQAIPFANLLTNLTGIAWGGAARMVPHVGQTTSPSDCYNLTDPYGNAIACTTSTTTQGLQEFLNATTSNGWPAVVYCQGTQFPAKTEPIFINASSTVTVPVAQDWSFHSYGCNLNSAVTTVPAMIVDSEGASVFDWDGKIVYNVTSSNGNTQINPSCVVVIRPQTSTADGFAGLYAGNFRIKSPVANPISGDKATGVVCIDVTSGNVIQQRIDFTEINGGGAVSAGNAYHGIFIIGAQASTGFQQNIIKVNQIHGIATDGINVGFNGTNATNHNGNLWEIGAINADSTSARGIDTWGSSDIFNIGRIDSAEGGLGIGILTESTAARNKFNYGVITGWTTLDWSDSGTCNQFSGGSGASGGANGTKLSLSGGLSGCTPVVTTSKAPSTTINLPSTLMPIAANIGAL